MGGAEGSEGPSRKLYTIVAFKALQVESARNMTRWKVLTCIGPEVCTYTIGVGGSNVSKGLLAYWGKV